MRVDDMLTARQSPGRSSVEVEFDALRQFDRMPAGDRVVSLEQRVRAARETPLAGRAVKSITVESVTVESITVESITVESITVKSITVESVGEFDAVAGGVRDDPVCAIGVRADALAQGPSARNVMPWRSPDRASSGRSCSTPFRSPSTPIM